MFAYEYACNSAYEFAYEYAYDSVCDSACVPSAIPPAIPPAVPPAIPTGSQPWVLRRLWMATSEGDSKWNVPKYFYKSHVLDKWHGLRLSRVIYSLIYYSFTWWFSLISVLFTLWFTVCIMRLYDVSFVIDMLRNVGVVGLLVLSTVNTILRSLIIGLGGRARVNAIRTPETAPKGRVLWQN